MGDLTVVKNMTTRLTLTMIATCAVLAWGAPAWAAEPAEPSVADLVKQFPPEDMGLQADLLDRLIQRAPDVYAQMCELLTPPGAGDDTAARMALHGMAMELAQPPRQFQRQPLADALAAAAGKAGDPEVRQFLLDQLRFVAGPEQIAPVAPLLAEADLCDRAAMVLVSIGEESAAALRAALGEARGKPRIAIVQALGQLGDSASAAAIRPDATSADRELRLTALNALANMGDADSQAVIAQTAQTEAPYERSQATAALLLLARRLGEAGRADQAASIARELYDERTEAGEVHVRIAALGVLADARGVAAFDTLLAATADESLALRRSAEQIAISMPGEAATRRWVAQLAQADAAGRVTALRILAGRGDRAALPTAIAALQDADEAVRIEAIAATADLGGAEAVGPLAAVLDSAGPAELTAAKAALATLAEPGVNDRLVAALSQAEAPGRQIGLMQALAARHASIAADAVTAFGWSENAAVRMAALDAMAALGGPDHLGGLVGRLVVAAADDERRSAEQAVVAVMARVEDPEARAEPLLAVGDANVPTRLALLRALGKTGSARALGVLRSALQGGDEPTIDVAIRALADWPNEAALDDLRALTAGAEAQTHRVLAFRGYVRLLGVRGGSDEQRIAAYAAALVVAPRKQDNAQVLAALAEIGRPEALAIADGFLGDDVLQGEAAAAVIRIADRLPREQQAAAVNAVRAAGELVSDNQLKRQARALLRRHAQADEFLTDWLLAGPYVQDGTAGLDLFDVAFAPETAPADAQWQPLPKRTTPDEPWAIDLNNTVAAGDDRVVYLLTQVFSPAAQEARLDCGSDDGIKVWLNGRQVHGKNEPRGNNAGDDQVKIRLEEGWNVLLLKINNGRGGFGANAAVRSSDGKALEGLKVKAELPPQGAAASSAGRL